MAEVVDIVHRMTFDINSNPVEELTAEFGDQFKQIQALQKEIIELRGILVKSFSDETKSIKELNSQLDTRKRKIDGITQSIAKQVDGSQRLTNTVKRLELNTNGVGIAFANIARDAPFGIIGVGNNITQAFDAISIAMRDARAQGLTTGQAFAAIGGSLLSLNTVLSVGVTLLTLWSMKMNKSASDADKAKTSIDGVTKALDAYAKIFENVDNFNDEGTNAIKRNIDAIKAQGVQAGETHAAEKKIFEEEQRLRRQERDDLNARIKLYQSVSDAVVAASNPRRRSGAPRSIFLREGGTPSQIFEASIAGLPRDQRAELVKAFNEGTLNPREIKEQVKKLREDEKKISNDITQSEVSFNSQQREKEYALRVELANRINENEAEYAKLRLERGKETFDKIHELNEIELKENERKLNEEIEQARKAGTLSLEVQREFEAIRLQIRKEANEKLLQENLKFFNEEREDLETVIAGLSRILNPAESGPRRAEGADLGGANDNIKKRLKAQEDAAKRDKQIIDESLNYAYNTTIQTLQSIYDAQLYYLDKEIALRRERVDQAVLLAEKGNTDILAAEQDRLRKTEEERERVAERQLQLNALLQASSAAIAATQAIQVVTNAGATGDPYSTAARIAAAVAALAAGFAFVTSLTQAFKFKDGVIGLDGPGSETSDSIPARLSKGESVMTAAETREFKPYLEAMREGTFYNMIANTAQPVFVQGNNYGKLEKKLDGVIAAVEGIHISANQKMDKNGISQAIESYKRQEGNRWR